MSEKKCQHCAAEMIASVFSDAHAFKRAKFCNHACYSAWHAAKTIVFCCEFCGSMFSRRGSLGSRRFCSTKCRYAASMRIGHTYVTPQGYVAEKVGPSRYVLQHRLIMAGTVGRPLNELEVVHHENGIKTDNRPLNLRLFANDADHIRHHHELSAIRGEPCPYNTRNAIDRRWQTRRSNRDCVLPG